MLDLFEQLNENQLAAVTTTEGYVRIVAGAGSGKTRTLAHRYGYLVKAAGIPPSSVLCVTFTNKAAGEMKKRVRDLIGDGYDNSLITTYHGFCVRVLREDIHRLFYPQSFTILDENDQRRILTEIYGEFDLKMDRATFEKLLDTVHRLKSTEAYVADMIRDRYDNVQMPQSSTGQNLPADLEAAVVRRYLEKQKKVYGLDFDDLVSFTFEIFNTFPEVREKWAERLYYIQVDEFQDSSARELRLIRSLSGTHGNLFVVGDPDQNIYEWRGADMSILVDFDQLFPGTETILLNRNYRSTGHILRCANTLIAHNQNRIPKDLYTTDGDGPDVIHLHAKSEAEEGRWIAGEILRLTREENRSFREIAVLYRSGFLSRFAEQALMDAGIPYELYGSVRFYERMEIKDTLSYLRLIQSDDDEAFTRIINTPRRSFGKAKMNALQSYAAEDRSPLYAALKNHLSEPAFARSGAADFVAMIEDLRAKAESAPVSELMQETLTRSGYESYIRELGSMERLDNLAELKRSVWEKEQSWGEAYPLALYLQQAALEGDRDAEEDADKVRLMTIHASKGLEFPVCFVCGLTEGIFPSARTLEERKESGLEEERRLCFVAVTRAMKHLYLTESEGTGNDRAHKRPSRFLYDVGEENYTRIGVIPKELAGTSAPPSDSVSGNALSVGSVVEHPIFGRGIVNGVDSARRVYDILFEKTGARRPVSMDYDFEAWKNLTPPKPQAEEKTSVIGNPPVEEKAEVGENPQEAPLPQEAELPPSAYAEIELPAVPSAPVQEETIPDRGAEAVKTDVPPETPDTPQKNPEMPMRYRNADWARAPDGEENLWKRDDVPHEGWVCEGIVDLGEPVGTCRMCGRQIIRYVHIMRHPAYPRKIGAGCVCAGRMEGNPDAARERETAFKNRLSRRETFLHTPLKRSRNGNEYLRYKGEVVTVLPDKFRKGFWKTVLRGQFSPSYASKEDALADAFDILDPWELGNG